MLIDLTAGVQTCYYSPALLEPPATTHRRSAKNAGFLLGYQMREYVDHKDRERHERIWYDSEGNERHDPKPKKQKRTARLSTGGKAPRKLLATRASRST